MKTLLTLLIASVCTSIHAWPFFHSGTKTDNGVPIALVTHGTTGDKPNNGTVILLHGCSGPNTMYENFASLLAGENFNAIIIDSWGYRGMAHGHGPNSVCSTYSVTGRDRLEEVYKAVEWINKQQWHKGNIYLIGWSHGGMTALAASKDKQLEKGITKSVAFYPYCLPGHFTNPTIPTQIHIGKDDNWTPAWRCRNLYSGAFSKSDKGEVFEYEDSHHGFDGHFTLSVQGLGDGVIQSRTVRPNHDAKKLAYERVFKFLKDQ